MAATDAFGPSHGTDLRILTYSHDGYGLGHLRRSIRLACGLSAQLPGASILAATGSWVSHYFRFPPAVDYLKLPSIAKLANEQYRARALSIDNENVIKMRSAILEATVRTYLPDLLLVDRYPLGVRKELRPALEALKSVHPQARLVLGLRDILDDPAAVREEWERHGHSDAIERLYDRILFYGDKAVYDAVAEYDLPRRVSRKAEFTGYLAAAEITKQAGRVRAQVGANGGRLAVCTLGGGEDGVPVARAFIEAIRQLSGSGWTGILIAGPFMPAQDVHALRQSARSLPILVRSFVDDLPSYLNAADVVVSMGGYNTLCEVLALAVPCVVVPRVGPRTEQLIRARLFAERGVVLAIHPDDVDAQSLAAAMLDRASLTREEVRERISSSLEIDGVDRAVAAILATAFGDGTRREVITDPGRPRASLPLGPSR